MIFGICELIVGNLNPALDSDSPSGCAAALKCFASEMDGVALNLLSVAVTVL